MDTAEARSQVLKIAPFGGLDEGASAKVVTMLLAVSEQTRREHGYALIAEGDQTDDRGYILLQGEVSISKSSGKELRVAAPALLGEMKQHSASGKRGATVTASGPCILLEFEWGALHSRLGRELAAGAWSAFRIALERYSWDYLLGEGL